MLKKSISLIFMVVGFSVYAQIPKQHILTDTSIFPIEKVQISINSELLLAGELLQYKAYSLNSASKNSNLSKVLYVSLRNENDSIVFSHKLKVENGTANGDFFIPSSLKTGIYRLIGYTNFSRNNKQDSYVQKNIYVLNTFVKTVASKKDADTVNIGLAPKADIEFLKRKSNNEIIQVSSNKQSYDFREKVILTLETPEKTEGNYVLSVRKINPVEISENVSENINDLTSEIFYVPELRGELISGKVISKKDGFPIANKEVSLTIPGKDYVFKIAKTDINGRFFFSINEEYNSEKSIVHLNGSETDVANYSMVLDKKNLNISESTPYYLKFNPDLKDWLQERSVQLQIENAYFDVKKDSIFKENRSATFFNDLGTLFLLDDYTRFPTVRETFIEVVTLAAIRGSGANARFIVNNEYDPNGTAKFNDIDPLVLIDGMQILNNEDLINYNARDIKSNRVIIKPYRVGPKIFSGIIAVETKKGDFTPTKTEGLTEEINLPPAVKGKKYFQPNYSEKSLNSRIPDYRVQLLWQADLEFSDMEASRICYTSDVSGIFEVMLEGYSNDGFFIVAKNYFTVSGE